MAQFFIQLANFIAEAAQKPGRPKVLKNYLNVARSGKLWGYREKCQPESLLKSFVGLLLLKYQKKYTSMRIFQRISIGSSRNFLPRIEEIKFQSIEQKSCPSETELKS